MSSFITGLGLLLFGLPLRLSIDCTYIFSVLIISATDSVQFDIMLVDTMYENFFTVGSPTLLYIFLDNLYLYIFSACESHHILFHCGDNIGVFCSVYEIEDIHPLFISSELDDPYIAFNTKKTILV